MKLSKKALLGMLLAAALTVSASAEFAKTATYEQGQFSDVPASEWYAPEVGSAYELGLMSGEGGGIFNPNGNVTVAEAVTMASRAAAIYVGETIDTNVAGEWYAPYVAYATQKGFVKEGQFDNYDRPATRKEVAVLFENAMPDGYFTVKNDVAKIPDVSDKQSYQADLLTLYKAGVVMGSDSYGNFFPENNITRAEAAAIINRVALPENRLSKTLDKVSEDDAYLLVTSRYANLNDNVSGIRSGWLYDMRGGAPQESYLGSYGTLTDLSETEGTAYIREINKTETGKLRLQTSIRLGEAPDGVYLEYQNDEGDSVYRLETVSGSWSVLGADGKFTAVKEIGDTKTFQICVDLDLDNGKAVTYLNGENCGVSALCTPAEKTNILNYRFATTEKSLASASMGQIKITVNYGVYESFVFPSNSADSVPFDWTVDDGVDVVNNTLSVPGGAKAARAFDPISGKVIASFNLRLPKSETVSYSLRSGAKEIALFTSDADNFYVNGKAVYSDYVENLWYRIRIELDTDTQKMTVKVNGRNPVEVDFAAATTSVDNFVLNNNAEDTTYYRHFRVYRYLEHDDYVPVPVVPKGEEKYNVGLNICSLWVNELHNGWSCISPYDDVKPVLGYYDEGNPETADWEIKYLLEHGVDFQAFCVYIGGDANAPLDIDDERTHLYSGFMNAKYSDMTKFCIIWEAANSGSPTNMESWKNNWVPYFIENFFKDDRYMTVDNKPLVYVFGPTYIAQRLGGVDKAREAFDYLEEEVKKLGFDGVLFVASNVPPTAEMAAAGYDATAAYNWSREGYQLKVNTDNNINHAKQAANNGMFVIPTISVGFNNIGWNREGVRYPMMSMEDYAAAQKWVKEEFLTTYAKEDWQKNLVFLSTWNEYGEGTYIMPTADERGFGYLDVLREAYTDEKADPAINTVPTEEQARRINRMYPQYRHVLRRKGYGDGSENGAEDMNAVYSITYYEKGNIGTANMSSIEFDEKSGAHGVSGGDALMSRSIADFNLNLKDIPYLRVTCQAAKGEKIQIFFNTQADGSTNEVKSFIFFSESDEMQEYLIPTTGNSKWLGKLTGVRVDPVDGADKAFAFKSIEFLAPETAAAKTIRINTREFDMTFAPQTAENGALLIAFDPGISMDYRLGAFYTWDKDGGVLTLNCKNNKTIVYTVGKNTYTLNGAEKSLGFTMTAVDGLPLIPIEQFCKDVGYTYKLDDKGIIEITTDDMWYFEKINDRKEGQWEFDLIGDTEGWSSGFMSLEVTPEGYMSCQSLNTSTDPTIMSAKDINLDAFKYTKLTYRVRANWQNAPGDNRHNELTMYFITNTSPNWQEAKTLKIPLLPEEEAKDWHVYSIDTSSNPLWTDTITQLRFDPFNAVGHIDIDYIRFEVDPNYVDPEKRPFELKNPDAESGAAAFTDTHNKMQIVADPENSANKVYYLPCEDTQIWLYARQKCRFKPGATYTVDMDVRIAGHGTTPADQLDPSFKATILANMVYSDPDSDTTNHLTGADGGSMRCNLSVADGWKHFTFTFTVNPNSIDRSQDTFSIYSDPVDGIGVGYYFDNIVVKETLPE